MVMNPGKVLMNRGLLSQLFDEERNITVDEACDIRLLLFGNTVNSFHEGWTKQGFKFRTHPSYGFTQKYGGPCGVLAAVQAYVIYELLFGYSRNVLNHGCLKPTHAVRKEALARALGNILWQAGHEKAAIVARKDGKEVLNADAVSNILEGDGLIECVKLKSFRVYDCLLQYIFKNLQVFMEEGGCILYLYSVVLTHGIDNIKEEMDFPDSHLIGNDGYCSLEVVNLFLIGKAVPNLFDGDRPFDWGGEKVSLLRGIPKRSRVGLLSTYEYQNADNVGSYYKDPHYPIWVIFGESHFTVLFGTSRSIFKNPNESFKLFYIDSLGRNQETSFKISPGTSEAPEDGPLSVVLRCIYTRWPAGEFHVIEDL